MYTKPMPDYFTIALPSGKELMLLYDFIFSVNQYVRNRYSKGKLGVSVK